MRQRRKSAIAAVQTMLYAGRHPSMSWESTGSYWWLHLVFDLIEAELPMIEHATVPVRRWTIHLHSIQHLTKQLGLTATVAYDERANRISKPAGDLPVVVAALVSGVAACVADRDAGRPGDAANPERHLSQPIRPHNSVNQQNCGLCTGQLCLRDRDERRRNLHSDILVGLSPGRQRADFAFGATELPVSTSRFEWCQFGAGNDCRAHAWTSGDYQPGGPQRSAHDPVGLVFSVSNIGVCCRFALLCVASTMCRPESQSGVEPGGDDAPISVSCHHNFGRPISLHVHE